MPIVQGGQTTEPALVKKVAIGLPHTSDWGYIDSQAWPAGLQMILASDCGPPASASIEVKAEQLEIGRAHV